VVMTPARRPPLSQMTDRPTREAAGYRRSFVVHGRSAWFAFTPSGPSGQSYGVRGCPTWAEAYAHAYASADKCAVCGNCFHDHGGWNHAYTNSETLRIPDSGECGWRLGLCTGCEKCEQAPYGPLTKAQWWDEIATRDTPDSGGCPTCRVMGIMTERCRDCGRKASYRPPAAEPDSPAIRCSNCLSPAGMGHDQGCRYEHPRP